MSQNQNQTKSNESITSLFTMTPQERLTNKTVIKSSAIVNRIENRFEPGSYRYRLDLIFPRDYQLSIGDQLYSSNADGQKSRNAAYTIFTQDDFFSIRLELDATQNAFKISTAFFRLVENKAKDGRIWHKLEVLIPLKDDRVCKSRSLTERQAKILVKLGMVPYIMPDYIDSEPEDLPTAEELPSAF